MTAAAQAGDILIDTRSGTVRGAAAHELTAISLLRAATAMLHPLHNFGFSHVARLTAKLLPSRKSMTFRLADDSTMRVGYCDPYWSSLLKPGYPYEPWIAALLSDSTDVAYGFVDGGANYGYWSVLASGEGFGGKTVVAVEAAADTFERLEANRALNGGRFAALNKAVGPTSGEHVRVYGAKHESRSTVAPSADARPLMDCETITIDDIAARPEFAGLDKFIVKLDVEGVEIAAFSGATRLLAGDCVFIYEDHGSDRSHETTRYVLEKLGMRVFWLGEQAREIVSPDELDGIKKARRRGYDLAASRSPFWIARLERLGARPGAREL